MSERLPQASGQGPRPAAGSSGYRVLIVDDSATARLCLQEALESDPHLTVVGAVGNGIEALRQVRRQRPDLVTMDVFLDHDNGIEVTAAIMASCPSPILVVTGVAPDDPRLIYQALAAGALDVVAKLPSSGHPSYARKRARLLRLVKALAQVPVVHRAARRGPEPPPHPTTATVAGSMRAGATPRAIVIGASTGGPPVVARVLRDLAAPSPVPIVIVQHMSEGFAEGFARWLAAETRHEVLVTERETELRPRRVYLAAPERHLLFASPRSLVWSDAPPWRYQKPSIDLLFLSAAEHLASGVVAVLLTGMGRDGADGLAALHEAGSYTIAQEPETCVVRSMPAAAIQLGAADLVAPPESIAAGVLTVLRRSPPAGGG